MHELSKKVLQVIVNQEIICTTALVQPANKNEASFHLHPANPAVKNLGRYLRLFHNTATLFFPPFNKLYRHKILNLAN
jgi:hypothetical protein